MKTKIRVFQLSRSKKIKLKYFGPFVSNSRLPPQKIGIDEYFDMFSLEGQRAIIWHELYHRKNSTGLKRIWWGLRSLFTKENTKWIEEFNADAYSAKICGKRKTLKFLYKFRELYKKGIEYNPKTHPSIKERIKRIKDMKLNPLLMKKDE